MLSTSVLLISFISCASCNSCFTSILGSDWTSCSWTYSSDGCDISGSDSCISSTFSFGKDLDDSLNCSNCSENFDFRGLSWDAMDNYGHFLRRIFEEAEVLEDIAGAIKRPYIERYEGLGKED